MATTFTFNDLIAWSARLSDWQRDALRRVLTSGITSTGVAELAEMAKAVYGGGAGNAPTPIPATLSHVRPSSVSMPAVCLVGLRDISRVNALAAGPIAFSPDGLTVVYGENASGKSGIARILKKACRARDPGGPIRASVFDPPTSQPASAVLTFRVNVQDLDFHWTDGAATNENLATINVFDGDCAAVQIGQANRISYTPEILLVFSKLASVCEQVAGRLRAEKAALEAAQPPQLSALDLRPGSAAGTRVRGLSKDTDLTRVNSVCDFTDDNRQRKATLSRALQDKPGERAAAVDARLARLERLERTWAPWARMFSDAELDTFEKDLAEAAATGRAAEVARAGFASSSQLDGLGVAEWRQLWESARQYSQNHAYPGEPFPFVRDDALCVLCQQPIGTDAASRLEAFEQFVQSDVQQRAERQQKALEARRASIAATEIPRSRSLVGDTELADTDAGRELKRFVVVTKLRRRYVLRQADGRKPGARAASADAPDISQLRDALSEESRTLRAAANAAERQKMERELLELTDRENIAPMKHAIHQEVKRLSAIHLLERAFADCNTSPITRKAGEVEQLIVTATLRNEFTQNLNRLGFAASAAVDVKLGPGQYGEHPYYLSLTVSPDVPPADILSDGEKRCVALAGFLAELDTTKNSSAVIFDDPVSSLDHRYRDRVAEQLVSRAKSRQVIILTHDIVFLRMLHKHVRTAGVPLRDVVVNRGARVYGIPSEGPPWIAMRVKQRLGVLRNELQTAEALLNKGDRPAYEQKAEWIYGRLRKSWERALEELLLNEVIVRFGDEVHTERLRKLTDISDADVQLVDEQMSRCSRLMHDQSGAVNEPIPEPDVVRADLTRLDEWVADLRKNRGRG